MDSILQIFKLILTLPLKVQMISRTSLYMVCTDLQLRWGMKILNAQIYNYFRAKPGKVFPSVLVKHRSFKCNFMYKRKS